MIDDDEEQQLLKLYIRLRSPFKVAQKMALDIADVLAVLDKYPELTTPQPVQTRVELHDGWGPVELRPHLVARKRPTEAWDNTTEELVEARGAFEDGTHDMTTGRDGDWLLLYLIPRKVRQPRPLYFSVTNGF